MAIPVRDDLLGAPGEPQWPVVDLIRSRATGTAATEAPLTMLVWMASRRVCRTASRGQAKARRRRA